MYMGMESSFWFQVCSTLKKPISAPRCLGIASDFEKGFRTGAEQQTVDDLLVLQGQWGQR